MISLYFHIPFCTKKCPYCHFYVVKDNPILRTKYLHALKKEWDEKKALLYGKEIISIYFGGGTPSLLSIEEFSYIFSFFEGLYFNKNIEITLEANPESLNHTLLKHLNNLGVNRVSLGVQSLDDSLLYTLGRTHDATRALMAIDSIHDAGIHNLSIDLMYDVPNQSIKQFKETVKKAVLLPITHLSLYNLTIEPYTPFYQQKERLKIPKDEESLMMLQEALQVLREKEFIRYEISAFCKKGFESRHNTGYWMGRPFLGYGPSAFSYWEKSRFANISHITEYERSENKEGFREKLSSSAHFKELLAIRLRLFEPFPLSYFPEKIPDGIEQQLELFIQEGYLQKKEDLFSLTDKGALFYDTIAESIIE